MIIQGATIVDQPVCITRWGHYEDDYNMWNHSSWKIEDESSTNVISFSPTWSIFIIIRKSSLLALCNYSNARLITLSSIPTGFSSPSFCSYSRGSRISSSRRGQNNGFQRLHTGERRIQQGQSLGWIPSSISNSSSQSCRAERTNGTNWQDICRGRSREIRWPNLPHNRYYKISHLCNWKNRSLCCECRHQQQLLCSRGALGIRCSEQSFSGCSWLGRPWHRCQQLINPAFLPPRLCILIRTIVYRIFNTQSFELHVCT